MTGSSHGTSRVTPPRPRATASEATIELVLGDLVDERVDAIIAPVGDGGTGVSRAQLAIRRAAGDGFAKEYDERIACLNGGMIAPLAHVVTSGHALACRFVVHVRPLEANLAFDGPDEALARCLRSAFETCRALGVQSVALPAIGTGAYGYRVSIAARVAVRAAVEAQQHRDGPSRIRFLLAGPATLETFLHALSEARAELRR
jgi:O-acetyl-ADP-ribose deacetylase (regulator of RNase III)